MISFCATSFGQETTYTPKGGVRPSKGKVDMESVRLLADQDLIGRNISAETLAAFIKNLEKIVTRTVPKDATAFELRVKVTLFHAAGPKFELASNGDPPQALLQNIYDALQKSPDVRSKSDAVPFELHFIIKAKS